MELKFKGEVKAKISNFFNIVFEKPKVNCVWLFLLFFCFLRAQKLNQHPAVTYDMGNRDFLIKRNKCCYGYFLRCFAVFSRTQYSRQTSVKNTASLYGALSHVFPISYVLSCKNNADFSIQCNADGPKSE